MHCNKSQGMVYCHWQDEQVSALTLDTDDCHVYNADESSETVHLVRVVPLNLTSLIPH